MRTLMLALSLFVASSFIAGGCGSSGDDSGNGSGRSARASGKAKVKQTGKLYEAARQNDVDEIEKLLAEGYDVDSPGRDGRTALWIASYEGYAKTATMLVEKGADPAATDDKQNRTPLMYAADRRMNDLLKKMLASKPNVNTQDRNGMTAAHMAANKRDVEAVRLLQAAGADLKLEDERGRTADDILAITVGRRLSESPKTTPVVVPPPPASTNPLQ